MGAGGQQQQQQQQQQRQQDEQQQQQQQGQKKGWSSVSGNSRDAGGFYKIMGVKPSATKDEIQVHIFHVAHHQSTGVRHSRGLASSTCNVMQWSMCRCDITQFGVPMLKSVTFALSRDSHPALDCRESHFGDHDQSFLWVHVVVQLLCLKSHPSRDIVTGKLQGITVSNAGRIPRPGS